MSTGIGFPVQMLIDSNLRVTRSGHPVHLRLRNFTDPQTQAYAQLGFVVSPSGGSGPTGYTDVLIAPPPSVQPVSVHSIGQSMGKLRFGAKTFNVSDTFVSAQAKAMGIVNDNYGMWISPFIIGFWYENMLYSIEDIRRRIVGGKTILWNITCNALELR